MAPRGPAHGQYPSTGGSPNGSHQSPMQLSDFDFALPPERIAQRPAVPRDSARLLVVGSGLEDRTVRDLPDLLRSRDLLVLNDTKVIPGRLRGRLQRPEAQSVEVTLLAETVSGTWQALAKPARKLRVHDRIIFDAGVIATVAGKGDAGEVSLAFGLGFDAVLAYLERFGAPPLPPYIKRPDLADRRDRTDYQTIYAARPGAAAAPTAGLHFTAPLLDALAARGIAHTQVTLHVGAGTFRPVTVQRISEHVMHREWGQVTEGAAAAIASARAAGGRIVAVGTTALRLLETAADQAGTVCPFAGWSDLFIRPGYRVRTADLLLTNFHLPRSTLFMLVCAFAGRDRMKAAYAHAIAVGYRFYSYGDASLLSRHESSLGSVP